LLSLLSLVTPIKPSVDKDNEGKDKNIEDPVEVEDKDIGLPLPPPPLLPLACFISI